MKVFSLLSFLCASLAWSQAAAPPAADIKPDAVIAIFSDGTKMTQGEFQALVPTLPANYQTMAQQNAEHFLRVYDFLRNAAAAARDQKLDEKSPYKQGVDFAVTNALAQAEFLESTSSITVSQEEIEKYYQAHKEPYRQIKVSGLKVAFGGTPDADANASSVAASRVPKKILTEEEARAKAEKLVAQVRAGADFSKLVLLESDDEATKAKGGDLGIWKMTDNVPDDLRSAVLGLQQGEVSNPIKQPGGFYIVHADAVSYAPLADVRDIIFDQVKQDKAKEWMSELDKKTKVVFPKDDQAPPASDPKK